MLSIISADMSLDKDAFNKIRQELESKLKKILVPTGRTFLNFEFEQKPDFQAASDYVDSLESEEYPYVPFEMCTTLNIHNVSNLFEEFSSMISETRHTSFNAGVCPLQNCPAYTKFTTMLGNEVDKILSSTKSFLNNKWNVYTLAEMDFNNEEGDYQDELKVKITVYVK